MLIWRSGVRKYSGRALIVKIEFNYLEFNSLFRNIKRTILMYYYLVTSKV